MLMARNAAASPTAEASRSEPETLLALEGVSLSFGAVTALSNLSLEIRQGEILAIIGPNGAGKTSLLNCINGFYRPTEGDVVFKGQRRRRMTVSMAARSGIARTFQNLALFKGLSTLDNLMTGRSLKMKTNIFQAMLFVGWTKREEIAHRERVEDIIHFLELEAVRETPVGRLPYGIQKRIELGRAIAAEPELILLDEPMAGMNHEEKQEMSRFILEINGNLGITLALIEHDIGVIMGLSHRIVVLDHGEKIAEGLPEQVAANPAVIDAYLGVEH